MTVGLSETQIGNMALSHIGARSRIESLGENRAEATEINLWYDWSRRQILEAFDWGFARKRLKLALHGDTISTTSTDPLAGVWGFRYQYPADAIVMRKIQHPNAPPDDAIPFDIELNLDGTQKTILTDMNDAVGVYTSDITSPTLFSPFFVSTLSHLIAHYVAFPLTGKRNIKGDELQIYNEMIRLAPAHSANERMGEPPRDTDWIRARSGTLASGTKGGSWVAFPDASN